MPNNLKNIKNFFKQKNVQEVSHFFFLFVFIFLVLIVIINLGTISNNLQYSIGKSLPERVKIVGEAAMTKSAKAKPKPQINSILIPKIGVKAPIVLAQSDNEKDILLALKEGVVLYPSFSRPGEKGTVIISGHSSPHIFYRGKYNTVFTLLYKLVKGDQVLIYYNNEKLIYKTINKYYFSPSEEIEQQKEKSLLLLVTCYPPGTDLRRVVIEAELIKK